MGRRLTDCSCPLRALAAVISSFLASIAKHALYNTDDGKVDEAGSPHRLFVPATCLSQLIGLAPAFLSWLPNGVSGRKLQRVLLCAGLASPIRVFGQVTIFNSAVLFGAFWLPVDVTGTSPLTGAVFRLGGGCCLTLHDPAVFCPTRATSCSHRLFTSYLRKPGPALEEKGPAPSFWYW